MRRILGPLVIILTLALGGFVQPLLDKARAAGTSDVAAAATAPQVVAEAAPAPARGNPGVGVESATNPQHYEVYGPVDQSAPLDFSTQNANVPKQYVAGRLYNVQVYKKYNYAQLLGQMAYFTQALGVQCTYCHNVANFAYDTRTKKLARSMAIMSNAVSDTWVDPVKKDYANFAVSGAVGCVTCHRGNAIVGVKWNIVPVQYLDYKYKSTKQAGYVVNSMYSAAKSLGVNCLFCHNSADFISLQNYPTNQIAHRMWRMVDAINHQYLPADVPAVTCYTCHQGAKWPQKLVTAGLDQTPVEATAAHPEFHENPGAHLVSGAP